MVGKDMIFEKNGRMGNPEMLKGRNGWENLNFKKYRSMGILEILIGVDGREISNS